MSRCKKGFIGFLSILLILLFIEFPYNSQSVEAASAITPLRYSKESNYRYFVGMMYYEMWKSTDGKWTDGERGPNMNKDGDATFTYRFQFPGRKIKNVEARIFKASDPTKYFEESRYDTYDDFRNAISTRSTDDDIKPFQKQGIGTSTTTIPITVNIKLTAPIPHDVKDTQCPSCAPEVEAYRIYVPILFKIELDSALTVKHFTVNGTPLDSIFPPRQEELKVGDLYEFTPQTHAEYEYVGYKKSSESIERLQQQSITEGILPSFSYNGNFENYYVYLYYDVLGEEPVPEDPPDEPSVVCTPPASAGVKTGSLMNGSAVGKIKADNRGSEKFEVAKGIPTSESLYGVVQARTYLYNNKFEKFTGTCTFTVPVSKTYNLRWKEKEERDRPDGTSHTVTVNKSSSVTVTPTYEIVRPYSYWTIPEMQAFRIDNAKLQNYAFEGGEIIIRPSSSYNSPTMNLETYEEHLEPPVPVSGHAPSQTIDGGNSEPDVPSENLKSYAEAATPLLNVRNDDLDFNGQKIMDGSIVKTNGPTPSNIPTPTSIDENALYKPKNMIPRSKANRANNESTGTIRYLPIEGSLGEPNEEIQPVGDLNPVTVHTPVVLLAAVSNDKPHNQRTKPDKDRAALILNRPFTVTLPTSGQHREIRGYGNRDYVKYVKTKQVYFPFDVFSKDQSQFYPKGTWIDIPPAQVDTTFFLPVWIDEGNYRILYRTIAENAPDNFTTEENANLDLTNHVATDFKDVQIIGRLYDFRVTDIADPSWETVFRTAKGSSTPRGISYWVGLNGIDGQPNGTKFPYVLPILRGSHPLENYKNVAVKTGYSFKFDVKTIGNMFEDKDAIRITPSFYFQDNNPSTPANRVPVDLYYHSDTKKFVKIGSAADVERRNVTLNNRLRNVPYQDMVNTAESIYDLNTGWTILKEQYLSSFLKRANEATYVGGYDIQILPSTLRTFINTLEKPQGSSVSSARVNASIQQWYGEYSLPAGVYIVPRGTDLAAYGRKNRLDDKSPIFLKNGYVTVNFNIESIRNGDFTQPYLQYIHAPLNNQWWDMEGFDSTDGKRDHFVTDPYGVTFKIEDGDVIFYDAKLSSYDDFAPKGTH